MGDLELFKGFTLLFSDAREPVAIIRNNQVVSVNKAAYQILGLDKGENILSSLDRESHHSWSYILEQSKKHGLGTGEVKFNLKHGKSATLKIKSSYHADSDQMLVRFDFPISIPKVLSEMSHFDPRFLRIFNSTLTGIVINDENGVIVDINDKACDFFNLQKHDLLGKSITVIFDLFPEDIDRGSRYIEQAHHEGFSQTVFKCNALGEDEVKYFQFFTSSYDEKKLYMTIIRDETEKEMMKFQIEHNNSLSTLGQLAASIAHEIRNPMTSLKGFSELLKLTTDEEGKSYLAVIEQELNRMDSILNEFLILSKPSKMDKVIMSVHEIILDVLNIMQPQAIMRNIAIQYEKSTANDLVHIEPNRIKQVLINLIKNAIEVSEVGGRIGIKTEMEDEGQLLKISVSDEGKGLTEHQIEQVFLPFFTTKPQGTGLGLPFVLKTIEEHGGTVSVSSKLGEGTAFQLLLPLYQPHKKEEIIQKDKILS